MTNIKLCPATIRKPFANYSHGVLVPSGKSIVFASGQLGMTPDDVIPEEISEQAVICFKSAFAILAEAGMTPADTVRVNAYVTDRRYMQDYMKVRDHFLGKVAPASTLMIVSGFTLPEFKVEVELIAAR